MFLKTTIHGVLVTQLKYWLINNLASTALGELWKFVIFFPPDHEVQ